MGKGVVKLGDGNWAVKDGNLLAVKETNGRFKNTEFTVERGTRATYVGRDGLIKESDLQNTNLVLNGDYEELGSELITNGDFSSGSTGWENAFGGQWVISGGKATLAVGVDGSYLRTVSNILTSGKSYKAVITTSGGLDSNNKITIYATSNTGQQIQSDGTHTKYFTADGTSFRFLGAANDRPISIDSVSVQQVDPNDRWTKETGWTISGGTANYSGGSSNRNIRQAIGITNGKTYKIQYQVSAITSGEVACRFGGMPGVNEITATTTGTYVGYITANSSANGELLIEDNNNNFVGSVDNVSVQEIKTATPRIDFTNNTDGHLLLEPARTNLVTYSEDFSQWTRTGNTAISATNVTSPTGTTNATTITGLDGSGSNDLRFFPSSFNSANKNLIFSVYLKGSGTLRIQMSNGVDQGKQKTVTLTSDWKRYQVEGPFNSTNSGGQFHCNIDDTSATATTYDVWGAQLEEGSYPTSYIPTVGATATRSADVVKSSGTAADFNSTEGVLFADIAALANDGTIRYIGLNDGSTSNRVVILNDASNNRIRGIVSSGGTKHVDFSYETSDVTDFNKVAFKYKENDFALWVDGVQRLTDTSGPAPIVLNNLDFSLITSGPFYGKCKQLEVYKTGFSDDQLIRLTGTLGTHFFESYTSMAGALTYTIQ